MPPLPQATAAALAERAKDLLRDAARLTSGVDPNYIRDAQPDSLFEAVPLAAARQGCRRYADNPDEYSGLRQARVERACRPYLDSIGYGGSPTLELPFRGGQCDGQPYNVLITGVRADNGCNVSPGTAGANGILGPISIRRRVDSTFLSQVGGLCPGFSINTVEVIDRSGGVAATFGQVRGVRVDSITVTPVGGVDNCGNPPPEIQPGPRPDPVEPPGPRPFNPFPGIDVDIDVTVNPDLTFDVDFGVGPVTIDPFGDGGGGGGGGDGGPGSPGSPEDTGPGGDAEGEADDGQVLTGLRIDFVEPPIGGNEYAPGVYRGVCYIYMGTADGLDHDPAGAMLRSGQFVYAEKDFLTRWSVSANAGYNLRVTPYYRAVEAGE